MSFTTFQERALDIYTGQYMRISSQIERLYGMIDDIRNNMISTSNSQHRLLNVLVAQSERIFTKIEALYGTLDEIRDNIAYIIQQTQGSRQQTQGSRQQTQGSRQQQASRQNIRPNVVYDYRTPISPIEYLNTNTTTNTNRSTNRSTFGSQMSNILSSFLNTSVTIRPTSEQLDAASRLVRYGDIERPLSETCPISLDRFNIDDLVRQIHHCGHLFVPSQFDEWFQSNVRCPVCRFDVRNHVRDQNTRGPTTATATATRPTTITRPTTATARDPSNNEIVYDLSGNEITDNLLNTLSNRFFESLFHPSTNADNNDRFVYDPSNNILMYETIVHRNTEHR
jgi:hypothetical protein